VNEFFELLGIRRWRIEREINSEFLSKWVGKQLITEIVGVLNSYLTLGLDFTQSILRLL
jgi:hypothetical protein